MYCPVCKEAFVTIRALTDDTKMLKQMLEDSQNREKELNKKLVQALEREKDQMQMRKIFEAEKRSMERLHQQETDSLRSWLQRELETRMVSVQLPEKEEAETSHEEKRVDNKRREEVKAVNKSEDRKVENEEDERFKHQEKGKDEEKKEVKTVQVVVSSPKESKEDVPFWKDKGEEDNFFAQKSSKSTEETKEKQPTSLRIVTSSPSQHLDDIEEISMEEQPPSSPSLVPSSPSSLTASPLIPSSPSSPFRVSPSSSGFNDPFAKDDTSYLPSFLSGNPTRSRRRIPARKTSSDVS